MRKEKVGKEESEQKVVKSVKNSKMKKKDLMNTKYKTEMKIMAGAGQLRGRKLAPLNGIVWDPSSIQQMECLL